MPQAILCPQCNKKFSVGDRPPATYNCTQCGLLMDLTPFGGKERPAKAAGPPRARAGGGARRSSARSGARRRSPASREAYDDRDDGRFARPPPKNNSAAIICVVALVVAGIVFVVAQSSGDPPPPRNEKAEVAPPPLETVDSEPTGDSVPDVPKKPRKPRKKRKPSLRGIELETLPWPEEVDAATRARVETSIQEIYQGGRDSMDARDWLIAQGRPICGRLISEFKSIQKSPGFDNRNGASMAMSIDGVLRAIDGWIERFWEEPARIRAWGVYAGPSFIERIAKRWVYWWLEEEWKTHPRDPWDPRVDETDPTEGEATEPVEDEPEKKKPGFTKPVGRD